MWRGEKLQFDLVGYLRRNSDICALVYAPSGLGREASGFCLLQPKWQSILEVM